jgi:cysteine desulfurase/selenocysteine lyase
VIYFDNAATSRPKPPGVITAMECFLRETCANPGRSGHALSIRAARMVYETRESLARLFNCTDPLAVIFTKNATEALNLVLQGLPVPGDHVITSCMEHNSVLRPLYFLQGRGVAVTYLPCAGNGTLDPSEVEKAILPNTKLIVLSHASNVTGALFPIGEVGLVAERHGISFCVDAAQTAGIHPIDMRASRIDFLAFTGHKALLGPQGTGGLCLSEQVGKKLPPLLHGGTGSASDSTDQPSFLPDRFEAGTLNAVGLAGLAAGVAYVEAQGVEALWRRETELTARLIRGLEQISGIDIYGPRDPRLRIGVVSFNLRGFHCSEVALALEERAEICCRAGLHCAPKAHGQLGTFPHGTVRFSLGAFNNQEEIDIALNAVHELAIQGK